MRRREAAGSQAAREPAVASLRDAEAQDGRSLVGGEGEMRRGVAGDAELREERPDAAPAAGEGAGLGGGGGGAEAEQDVQEDVVG